MIDVSLSIKIISPTKFYPLHSESLMKYAALNLELAEIVLITVHLNIYFEVQRFQRHLLDDFSVIFCCSVNNYISVNFLAVIIF